MNFSSTQDPYPDENFVQEPKEGDGYRQISSRKEALHAYGYLFPIDEAEEFHDPFSDLSLFLSKRIKRELLREKNPRKWSQKIQTLLLKEILPEFTKKFPKYRLGNTALKKTWDKVLHHLQLIQQEKNALTPDGKINIAHFIKQNLKKLTSHQVHNDIHPYNRAHNLAVKISECIAAIDGERPKLEDLTKTIWSIQRHLLIRTRVLDHSPFERVDMLDKLIMRFQLELLTQHPYLTPEEVIKRVKHKIKGLKQLHRLRIEDLSRLLAEKLYPTVQNLSEESAFIDFIRSQMASQDLLFVKRVLLLYPLVGKISYDELKLNLTVAFDYMTKLANHTLETSCPVLQEELFICLEAEMSLNRDKSIEELLHPFLTLFTALSHLPSRRLLSTKELEIVLWKELQRKEDLPIYVKEIAFDELANIHIDQPNDSFETIVKRALYYFKKVGELPIEELDKKCKIASLQNDMIYSLLSFDEQALLILVRTCIKEVGISKAADAGTARYLAAHPQIAGWGKHLKTRMEFMVKYVWYNEMREEKETAYDRFLKWHFALLLQKKESLFSEILLTHLEHLSETLAPLFPFNRDQVRISLIGIANTRQELSKES